MLTLSPDHRGSGQPTAQASTPASWRRPGVLALAALLSICAALAIGSARQKSVTVDELGHLPSGLYYLLTGDARFSTLNPPLVNLLSALPVLALDLETPPIPPPASDDVSSFWSNGYHFHEQQRADYLRIFAAARVAPIAVVLLLGVLVFAFARRLAPEALDVAGILAAGFVCLSPNVLAQARLVGTDTGTAFFVTLSVWGLWRMLVRPGIATTLLCGVTLGLAQLSKFYALLLIPAFVLITLVWSTSTPASGRPRFLRFAHLAAAFAIGLLVLVGGYLGQELGRSLADLDPQSALLRSLGDGPVGQIPLPLPGAYLRAIDGQLVEVGSNLPSFLMGERFQGGRWYYYLVLLAIKTPLGLMIVFALALWLSWPRPRLPRHELVLLLAYPVLLFGVLSQSDARQLGARALLSAVPLVWIAAAVTIARSGRGRWPVWIGGLALCATLAASLRAYPDYLSYFNPLVGGSALGYRYASDANIDIGQDLPQLARFLESEGVGADTLQLMYFGSVDPALYGIDYRIPTAPLEPGLFAISVSLYRFTYPMYDHGRLVSVGPVDPSGLGEPIANIGGSIHVYRIAP